jgi:beta-glucosidase
MSIRPTLLLLFIGWLAITQRPGRSTQPQERHNAENKDRSAFPTTARLDLDRYLRHAKKLVGLNDTEDGEEDANDVDVGGKSSLILRERSRLSSRLTRMRRTSSNRIEMMLSRMSTPDKIAQMAQIDINLLLKDDGHGGKELDVDRVQHWIGVVGVGSVLNTVGGNVAWNATQFRAVAVQLQQAALSRYQNDQNATPSDPILPIWGLDSVHGANYVHGAVLAPQPINLAATFNTSAAIWAGKLASRDTRAAGISWIFSPLLGVALEPKWSRVYETFGEDPLVVGRMAKSMIAGIQQPEPDGSVPRANPKRAAACGKHFVGYSMPRTGHDRSPSWIPTRHLYQYFIPPWKHVMARDDDVPIVDTVMESYTEIDGVPMVSNRVATVGLLRRTLNFQGVLVTDYEEMRNLHNWHRAAGNTTIAIIGSLRESSIDMSMIPWAADEFVQSLQVGLESNQLSPERIDASVRRILQLKLELDLIGSHRLLTMEDPNLTKVGNEQDRAQALDVAQQSIVVAENNRNTLPLSVRSMESSHAGVLVVGPTAHTLSGQSGGWTWQWQGTPVTASDESRKWFTYGTTVLDAARQTFSDVTYRCGVSITGGDCRDDEMVPDASETILEKVKNWIGWTEGRVESHNSIGRSAEAAEKAKVVLVCVGEEPYAEKPGDIRSLRLAQGQYDLVKALRSANSSAKIILVYLGGRPRLLHEMVGNVDAVMLGFLPGPDAGKAIVDIITGAINPSGRLPLTYPLDDDGGGNPYYHAHSDQCTKGESETSLPHFEYIPCPVQWPFGHGMSYTSFDYSNLVADGGIDRDLTVQVTVKNTGSRAGSESVLVYTFDEFRRTTPEYKRLRAFVKLHLEPNDSRSITVVVPLEDLKFIGPHDDRHYIIDPTMVTWVGVGSVDCRQDPASKDLCVRLESPNKDKPYVAACEAACNVWIERSGCANLFGFTNSVCLSKCMSISENPSDGMIWSNDGWGWDYVNCIESVVWGLPSLPDKSSCSKMTTLCSNIFQTGTLDESGSGGEVGGPTSMSYVGRYVALTTALVATGLIVYFMNGGLPRKVHTERSSMQFTIVSRNEDAE